MKLVYIGVIIYTIFVCYGISYAFTERDYQTKWCNAHNGIMEYVLPDKTRVDCYIEYTDKFGETNGYAVEFDFARKWAESYGQATYYARQTGKRPGIVLIMENIGDERYLRRLQETATCNFVKIWIMTPDDLK